MSDNPFPMHVGIVVMNAAQLAAVYSLLGGASTGAIATSSAGNPASAKPVTAPVSGGGETPVQESLASAASTPAPAAEASSEVPAGAEGVDAHGWPWSADMHASTGTKTKEGLWRMKVGVSRPDPKPGYPIDQGNNAAQTGATSTPTNGAAVEQAASATGANAGASSEVDEEDEFAAFRAAAAQSDAKAAEAAASAPARKYSDSDLAVLCNDAAVKLGDPAPVKALIAEYVGEGAVAHSRNVPEDRRAAFVAAVEAKAGITFKG